jgi:hypothetical protein
LFCLNFFPLHHHLFLPFVFSPCAFILFFLTSSSILFCYPPISTKWPAQFSVQRLKALKRYTIKVRSTIEIPSKHSQNELHPSHISNWITSRMCGISLRELVPTPVTAWVSRKKDITSDSLLQLKK